MPTIALRELLIGHVLVCALLFCLTPVAARGMPGLRPLAWAYAVILFLNGMGHTIGTILGYTVDSVTFQASSTGISSSFLFLFAASVRLMTRLRRIAQVDFQLPTSD